MGDQLGTWRRPYGFQLRQFAPSIEKKLWQHIASREYNSQDRMRGAGNYGLDTIGLDTIGLLLNGIYLNIRRQDRRCYGVCPNFPK